MANFVASVVDSDVNQFGEFRNGTMDEVKKLDSWSVAAQFRAVGMGLREGVAIRADFDGASKRERVFL